MSRIRTNFITNRFANGAPTVSNGLIIAGVTTFTGNIAATATFNDIDVDGHTNLDNVSIAGVATVTGALTVPNGGTGSNRISVGDSEDLKLYHNGHSYIDDTGSGNLYIQSNHVNIDGGGTQMANFYQGGAVELFFNNTSILSTASYGIAVNGDILFQDGLVHIGDTDTKVRFPQADTISFETAGNERVRISSVGSVGIGTVNPNSPLHVHHPTTNGVAFFESSDAYVHLIFKDSGSSDSSPPHFGVQGDDWRFVNGGEQNFRITSNGHLVTGGLDSPSYNNNSANVNVFEITGEGTDAKYGVINISGNENSTAPIGAIKFINRDNSNASSGSNPNSRNVATIDVYADTSDDNAGDDSGGYLRFATKPESGNLTERMRITSQGYVSGNVNVPCWFGRQDTAHNVATATWTTVINLGNDVTNPSFNNGAWSESNGIFTVQPGQAGTYYVFGACGIDDIQSDDVVRVGISKNNGSPAFFGEQRAHAGETNQIYQASIAMVITVAETDTIRLKVYHNEGSTEPTEPNRTYFGGYRLST